MPEIMDDVRDGFLGVSQSNTKPIEKPFLLNCWHVLKLGERPFNPGLLQQMKPGSIVLKWRQKAGQGMVPTGHTHSCFSAQGCRSGWRLYGKVVFGDKPPHLNMLLS
jgi:hypothetical protein